MKQVAVVLLSCSVISVFLSRFSNTTALRNRVTVFVVVFQSCYCICCRVIVISVVMQSKGCFLKLKHLPVGIFATTATR